jgi:hypothetical protein
MDINMTLKECRKIDDGLIAFILGMNLGFGVAGAISGYVGLMPVIFCGVIVFLIIYHICARPDLPDENENKVNL